MKSKVLQRKMFRDPSEDENVGIMQGFMDSLEEMLTGEGDMSEEEDDSPSGAPDRTPRSPEILMNTMRGDMRSVDARVEELADMVGYNAASSTPLEVLALLQPVLKQQGIAALPTSSAMPPSAAMAPPPSTSVPPVPTQGGGIATLPQGDMGQGPPPMDMPMPMQMADGGVVQHFQNGGATNDGTRVTMPTTTSSSTSTVSQRLRDAAEDEIVTLLQSKGTVVPSLQEAMDERIPLYRTILGTEGSGDSARANAMFDIAKASLAYAGNRDPQGQPLRGSAASRLAGAFSEVPAQMGARLTAKNEAEQAVRLAALQAAEKDVLSAQEANRDLTKEQRALMATITTTARQDPFFGSGREGRAESFVAENLDRFAAGEMQGRELDYFMTAINIMREPRVVLDPITGQPTFVPQEMYPRLVAALAAQGFPTGTSTGEQPALLGNPPAPDDQSFLPLLERNALLIQPRTENYSEPNMPSLWGATNSVGPVPSIKGLLFRTPLLSALAASDAGNITQAREFIQATKNALVSGFQAGTDRFSNTERQQLLKDLDLAPSVLDQPEAFRRRLYALDDTLQGFQASALAVYNNMGIPAKDRQDAALKLTDIHEIRTIIGTPLHASGTLDPRLPEMIARYPIGTSIYLMQDPNGGAGVTAYQITQQMKDLVKPLAPVSSDIYNLTDKRVPGAREAFNYNPPPFPRSK